MGGAGKGQERQQADGVPRVGRVSNRARETAGGQWCVTGATTPCTQRAQADGLRHEWGWQKTRAAARGALVGGGSDSGCVGCSDAVHVGRVERERQRVREAWAGSAKAESGGGALTAARFIVESGGQALRAHG